jgi:hypothetical protein
MKSCNKKQFTQFLGSNTFDMPLNVNFIRLTNFVVCKHNFSHSYDLIVNMSISCSETDHKYTIILVRNTSLQVL